jgi:hypothetical protein
LPLAWIGPGIDVNNGPELRLKMGSKM